jgi:uncharacterized protein YukE
MDTLEKVIALVQALIAVMMLVLTWRSFSHTRSKSDEQKSIDLASHEAIVNTLIAEFKNKLDSVMTELKAEAERFRVHDKDCAADKRGLAADIKANTELIKAVAVNLDLARQQAQGSLDQVRRDVSNLQQRIGFVTREAAESALQERLTGVKKS